MNSKNPTVRALVTALFWIAVAVIMFYVLFPFYWALKTSFTAPSRLSAEALRWFPSSLTWENYSLVFSGQPFGRNLVNSLVVATGTVILSLLLSLLAAYALAG